MDLTDIVRTFHPNAEEYTPSSQMHTEHSPGETISWGHKSNLSTFKKIEVISSIFYETRYQIQGKKL